MSQPVTIENELVRLEVWPQLGGKVSSLVDKADRHELLFNYPSELPLQSPRYDRPYADSWYAGWDECFPAVAPSRYSGHPYDGIAVPDHGELWGLPTTTVPTANGMTCVWHGLRFGYRLTRKLWLDGAVVVAEYSLVNVAPFPFRFVWAQHALLSMISPVELQAPQGNSFRWSHDAAGNDVQQPFDWPRVDAPGAGGDLSKPASLPAGRGWKCFSSEPIAEPFTVRYPQRRRALSIDYAGTGEAAPSAYWGLWINTGGWAGHRHFALEPTTGRFDQLDRSIKDGSAGTVAPSGRCDWTVRWTVSAIS